MLKMFRRYEWPLSQVLLALALNPLSAADRTPTDRLLAPGVLAYMSIPDVVQFKEKYSHTGYGEMANDPALEEVRTEIMDKFHEVSKEVQDEIGVPLSDLLEIPSGEMAIAVTKPAGNEVGVVLFLDFAGHEDAFNTLLDKLDGELTNQEWKSSKDSFEGTDINIWKNPGNGDGPETLAYIVKDSRFIASNLVGNIEAALIRWDGKHKSTLAESDTYAYTIKKCSDGDKVSSMYWYVGLDAIIQSGLQFAARESPQVAMGAAFLPILGIDKIKGVGGTIDMSTDEFDLESRTLLYIQQPATGIINMFVCPAAEQTPPSILPADLTNVSGVNWDVQKAFKTLGDTIDTFQRPGFFEEQLDKAENDPNGPGLHPKRDFVDLLNGRFHMIQELPEDGNPQQQQMVIMFELTDEARMKDSINSLMKMDGVESQTRDFKGTTIYESEAQGPVQPSMAIAQGHLMLSLNTALLERLLRSEKTESPLATDADFKTISGHFPKQVSTYSFARQDKAMESLYKMMKSGLENDENFDVDKLPPFEKLAKYFGLSGSYSVPDDNGVFMMSFSTKPKL